jgi:hypothetical protein
MDLRVEPADIGTAWIDRPAAARLLAVAAALARAGVEPTARAARGLLGVEAEADRAPARPSTLNNDGTPLQVCVSAGATGERVRLLADPCAVQGPAAARFARGRRALARALIAHGADGMEALCASTLRIALPERSDALEALASGMIWLAGGLGEPGMALYATARWGEARERWRRARAWVDQTLARSDEAAAALDALEAGGHRLASLAVEGASAARARAKIYFRLERADRLDRLGPALFAALSLRAFLVALLGDRPVARSGLVLAMGFSVATGRLCEVKVDVCAHCLPEPASTWPGLLDACAHALALAAPRAPEPVFPVLAGALLAGAADVAFVGAGISDGAAPRMNVYLKAAA